MSVRNPVETGPGSAAARMKDAWNRRASNNAFFYIETSDWNGDVEKFFSVGEERARILIDPVLREHGINPEGKAALDFGCGVGRFTRALAKRFASCVGVDVSEEMVAKAQDLHRHWPSHVTFLASDGMSLPVPDESVDFVFSYEVFQHFPSREVAKQGFAHIARVLRPDGFALIHCKILDDDSASVLRNVYRRVPDRITATVHRLLGKDVLASDAAFRGTLLPLDVIRKMCADAWLDVLAFHDDPTHPAGTRTFAVIRPARRPH